jgi:hypothetical protein
MTEENQETAQTVVTWCVGKQGSSRILRYSGLLLVVGEVDENARKELQDL